MQIRPAARENLAAAAEIYLRAFPDTLRDIGAENLAPAAVEDLFSICFQAEPEAVLVAEVEGRVVGYVICPAYPERIARVAVFRGYILRMAVRWAGGRYRIGLRGILQLARDKVAFWRGGRIGGWCRARILSVAVHPDFRGRGIGRALVEAALDRLRRAGAGCVKLEVRPTNIPAVRLYEKLGFRRVGSFRDTRGEWVVMVKELGAGDEAGA